MIDERARAVVQVDSSNLEVVSATATGIATDVGDGSFGFLVVADTVWVSGSKVGQLVRLSHSIAKV